MGGFDIREDALGGPVNCPFEGDFDQGGAILSESDRHRVTRLIEAELQRLRQVRGRLDLDVWDDGRVKIFCSTGMRICAWTDLLELLRELPSDAPWRRIWRDLFDFPEGPD